MTEYERMLAGLIYDSADEEVIREQMPCLDKLYEFNQLKPSQFMEKMQYMKEMFAECGERCFIELPFRASWGGHHIHMGDHVFINYNLTAVDDGNIYIGSKVIIGPNVVISTANHPIEPSLRGGALLFNKDVHIGENVWIGAGAIILSGVSIGKNTVIGAGSVVTRDIPENVVAAGNPCKVLREIGEHDREYFYKDEKIDWENIKVGR